MSGPENAEYVVAVAPCREGSPCDEKIDALLALVSHLADCVRRGGPSNFYQFLDPYQRSLVDEAKAGNGSEAGA